MNRNLIASELLKAAKEMASMVILEAKRKRRKKKPLNQERRMKQLMEQKPKKERGEPIPSGGYWDQGRRKPKQKRQDSKSKLRKEYVGSQQLRCNVAPVHRLARAAKELTAGRINTKYNYPTEKKAKMLPRLLSRLKIPAKRLSERDSFSINDEMKVHKIYDKLMDIDHELSRIDM